MAVKKLVNGIFWVGAEDWDRRLFDSLIPLPDGTSYNAYIVQGRDLTVLIDAVDPTKKDILASHLDDFPKIDLVIANHLEQDHSGLIPYVLDRYPQARLLATPVAKDLIVTHLHVAEDRIRTVADGERLDLGGRTIRFIHFPWVHWPETMLSYLEEDKILFSCDLFGSHLASSELLVEDEERIYEPAKRYFAEIMMPFRKIIQKNWPVLEGLEVQFIAPSHGPIYSRPAFIIDAYKKWVADKPENSVLIAWVSMHGSTARMVDHLIWELAGRGIKVMPFNLAVTDLGHLAMSLVEAGTIIVASPTILTGLHPLAAEAVFLVNALRPKALFAGFIGSYGWKSRALDQLKAMLDSVRFELLNPVQIKGNPKPEDLALLTRLADDIYQKHQAAALL